MARRVRQWIGCVGLLAALGCSRQARDDSPSPTPQRCATSRSERICCGTREPVEPSVFSSRSECESDRECAEVAQALEEDFVRRDVVVVSPAKLGITYSLAGPPTTLGTEWRIYQGLKPRCRIGGRETKLEARADAGGGSVVYAAAVAKFPPASPVSCSCE